VKGVNPRKNQIHILSLDQVLAEDIHDRIHHDPRMSGYRIIRPQSNAIGPCLAELESMVNDTRHSKLLVVDVRTYTLPMLQQTYNKIMGMSRMAFNEHCFTVLVGDGPMNLFGQDSSIDVFTSHLARYRLDYHPSVFFFDPFLHYDRQEVPRLGIGDDDILPNTIPARLARYFKTEEQDMSIVRRYFRAADVPPAKRKSARSKARDKLATFYKKRIAKEFSAQSDCLMQWLTKEGCVLSGEILRLHLYPFYFEDWVHDLLTAAG